MRVSSIVILGVLTITTPLLAHDDYWSRPGEKQFDASGTLILEEVKDPATFTSRIFRDHAWTTYRYVPHTERVARIEAPGTAIDFNYSADGALSSKTVHVGHSALTVRPEHTQSFGAGSMPGLKFISDSGGRETTIVTSSGAPVARYEIDTVHRSASLKLGNGMNLTITGRPDKRSYVERLVDPVGHVLSERVVTPKQQPATKRLDLDPVLRELSLDADWENNIEITRDVTSSVLTVTNPKGTRLLYVVQHGPDQFGFDSNDNALFYDVLVDRYRGHFDDPDVLVDMAALLPDHIVTTADGRVGAYVSMPASGAITGFWDERLPSGATRYAYRSDARPSHALNLTLDGQSPISDRSVQGTYCP